jgi:nicotinate-nucleotide adenylyltransferase
MKIGILGGTFNPPHLGHIVIAEEVSASLGLDKVLFVPTHTSPHKDNDFVSPRMRLAMLERALEAKDGFEVNDCEIQRGGISYTIDTVRYLKRQNPHDEFYLILGSDLANTFSDWREHEELKKLVKIVVACREQYPLKEKDDFILVDITQVAASSSRIRELISKGEPTEGLLDGKVAEYIKQHSLYAKGDSQ